MIYIPTRGIRIGDVDLCEINFYLKRARVHKYAHRVMNNARKRVLFTTFSRRLIAFVANRYALKCAHTVKSFIVIVRFKNTFLYFGKHNVLIKRGFPRMLFLLYYTRV